MTPEILHILTNADASVLTSVYAKTLVDLNFDFEAVPTFRSCELPAAYTILCVRFTHFLFTFGSQFIFTQTSIPQWVQHSIRVGG